MTLQKIYAILFASATSLNAFWILNIAKESSPAVKAFFNFYPVTGPLLGLYSASLAVCIVLFLLTRRAGLWHARMPRLLCEWYFMLSVLFFAFAVFPPVYVPIVAWLVSL